MTKLVLDISMSLDGYVTADRRTPDEPLGAGGEALHDWLLDGSEEDHAMLAEAGAGTGAVITGRRNYEDSIRWWGADGPTGDARLPVFVVSHGRPDELPEDGVYVFCEGIEEALAQARAAAGDRTVCVMGGAEVAQQYLKAGLVDEISIHLAPVLLGGGLRLFDHLGDRRIRLENLSSQQTAAATHLRFRVA
jgi:dihydrofolate reductase